MASALVHTSTEQSLAHTHKNIKTNLAAADVPLLYHLSKALIGKLPRNNPCFLWNLKGSHKVAIFLRAIKPAFTFLQGRKEDS